MGSTSRNDRVDKDFAFKVTQVFKEGLKDNLVSIVLFGSRARGDYQRASDFDLFIVVEELPDSPLKRTMYIREPIVGKFKEKLSIIAKTRQEMGSIFPSLFLDRGLDGIIIFDNKGFMTKKLKRIREIIIQAGLGRVKEGNEFGWRWKKRPRGNWIID